jgi:hypothetical protein
MSSQNVVTSIEKTMMFVPYDLKDIYMELPHNKVPTLIMIVKGDDILCCLDRKCPCDCRQIACSDKYEHFKLRRTDLSEWLENNPQFYRVS